MHISSYQAKQKGCGEVDFKQQYFNIWRTVWEYHKEFFGMNGTDKKWESAVNKSADIMEQYKDKPEQGFVKSLLLAVVDELERVDKAKRKEQK